MSDIHLLNPADDAWPPQLNALGTQTPSRLHLIGRRELLEAPHGLVAIVGTRNATAYGERVADRLGEAFASHGIPVVSGLARGVDAAAHRGALRAGGLTIAVQGTGPDVPYPVGHRALHEAICRQGLVVAEQPPGSKAAPGAFPRRNRIIAALARLVIVVEAPYKSGAMNTVRQAQDLGREVAAVPGPIDSPQSEGCNYLISQGAGVIATVSDALALLGVRSDVHEAADQLAPDEAAILAAIPSAGAFVEEVAGASLMPLRQAGILLTSLELRGKVWLGSDGRVSRRL